ncbi:MAG: helix-turn-helix domain-containing protein, partial [Candidatus Villigracilaceae bacterium]
MMADTIGQRLQKQRLARRLTLEQAAEATRIRLLYLQALENDDFTILPSPVQGHGFLRLYAQYLGLDVEALLDEMRQAAMQRPPEQEILLPETQPADKPPAVEKRLPFWEELQQRLQTVLSRPVTGADEPVAASSPKAEAPAADGPSERESTPSQAESLPQSPADQPPVPLEPEEAKPASASPLRPGWLRRLFPLSQRLTEDHQQTTPEAALSLPSSVEIFASIGAQLRERRELLSLTLEETEQHIRVRRHFLQAIEDGRFDDLPSPVQARGMLSNYAAFLDMDADEILLRFAEGLQARHLERQLAAGGRGHGKKAKRAGIWRSFFAPDLVIGLVLVLSLFVFVIWAAGRILDRQQ